MKYPTAPPCRTPVNEGHMISEVIVLNLPSRSDKFWSCYGALHAVGVPTERIKRWEAMPASDYENIEVLVDAVVKDGFPEFQTIYERDRCDNYLTINAQFWSYCQMLRYIAEKDITAIILYDDRYLLNWAQFVKLYQKIRDYQKHAEDAGDRVEFYMLQLEFYHDMFMLNSQDFFRVQATPECMRQFPRIPHIVQGPLGAGENAMLYTAEGAKYFLEKLFQIGIAKVEVGLVKLFELPEAERAGVWTCNYPVVDEIMDGTSNIFDPPEVSQ